MNEEKTVYQWRLQLPKNLRHRYVRNIMNKGIGDTTLNSKELDLDNAIMCFDWDQTPEGWTFWDTMHDLALAEELTPESKIEIPNNE